MKQHLYHFHIPTFLIIASVVILSTMQLSACGRTENPEHKYFALEIPMGTPNQELSSLVINQGDSLTIDLSSDQHGTVHLHGYDIEQDIGPDMKTTLDLLAEATGKFKITFHPDKSHEEHGTLFESATLSSGKIFTFKLPTDFKGDMIPFHNHMHHGMTGIIKVLEKTMPLTTIEIKIQEDGSFRPNKVEVQRGAEILWHNSSSDRQRVVSGNSPTVEKTHSSHEDDENELLLTSLIVLPR